MLGEASEVTVVESVDESADQAYIVGSTVDDQDHKWHTRFCRQKVRDILDSSNLQDSAREKLLTQLEDHQ